MSLGHWSGGEGPHNFKLIVWYLIQLRVRITWRNWIFIPQCQISLFGCVILFSFIYLLSSNLFQNLFEWDCFSASVSNLFWAPTLQSKGWEAGQCVLAESSGKPSYGRWNVRPTLVLRLTLHTSARCAQVSPWGSVHYCRVDSVIKHLPDPSKDTWLLDCQEEPISGFRPGGLLWTRL